MAAYSLSWTEEEIALLGKMTDNEVAKKKGTDNGTVKRERESRLIPNYNRREHSHLSQINELTLKLLEEIQKHGRDVPKPVKEAAFRLDDELFGK